MKQISRSAAIAHVECDMFESTAQVLDYICITRLGEALIVARWLCSWSLERLHMMIMFFGAQPFRTIAAAG